MTTNELIENTGSNFETTKYSNFKIEDITHIENYLFIALSNGQQLLADGNTIYDVSGYGKFIKCLQMGDRQCAVFVKGFSKCVVDLQTKEILFDDSKAYSVSKQDDRTLHVIMNIGGGNTNIYDIEKKQYLPMPENYEYENSLGNGLYVFREAASNNTDFYKQRRCVINLEGQTILKNIEGWIYLGDNYLIIAKREKWDIIELKNNQPSVNIKTLEKNDVILAKPEYWDGYIVTVEQNQVSIRKPNLEVTRTIPLSNVSKVLDSEQISNILKLYVPHTCKGEDIGKHIFINLQTGKTIEHLRIEGYPYWTPQTFIGKDDIDLEDRQREIIKFHFYNQDFELIKAIVGNSYYCKNDEDESLFIIKNGDIETLLNTKNGSTKDITYDVIHFHPFLPYGYGAHTSQETMDFFDENLNVIIPNFEYNKYRLNLYQHDFGYFIINDTVCITKRFVVDIGREIKRTIIYKASGELILDSTTCKCYPIGNCIQIIENKHSRFYNTITGEMGELTLALPINEDGQVDVSQLTDFASALQTGTSGYLMTESTDKSAQKVKKALNKKKDD